MVLVCIVYVFARIVVCICAYSHGCICVWYVFVRIEVLVLLRQTRIEECIGMYGYVFVSIGSFWHVLIFKY